MLLGGSGVLGPGVGLPGGSGMVLLGGSRALGARVGLLGVSGAPGFREGVPRGSKVLELRVGVPGVQGTRVVLLGGSRIALLGRPGLEGTEMMLLGGAPGAGYWGGAVMVLQDIWGGRGGQGCPALPPNTP